MVQTTPYGGGAAPAPSIPDPWDLLEGGGKPSLKFSEKDQYGRTLPAEIGTSYTGLLTSDLVSSQITDYDTKEPEFWDPPYNTRPKMQIVGELQVYQPTEEDDGIRRVYFKGQMFTALQTEMQEKRTGRVGPGTRFTITLVDLKPPKRSDYNPTNIYRVDIGPEIVPWVAPQQRAVDAALQSVQGPVQPATQQQWATPAQPAFAGQVVPVATAMPQPLPAALRGQLPPTPGQIQQAGTADAVQAQPVSAQGPSAAENALNAILAQHPEVANPVGTAAALPLVSQEDVNSVGVVIRAGLSRDQAISTYAQQLGKGADFIAALSQAVPA